MNSTKRNDQGSKKCNVGFCQTTYKAPLSRLSSPMLSGLLKQLKSAKVFIKVVLQGAYNLVQIKERDKWKTTFCTR